MEVRVIFPQQPSDEIRQRMRQDGFTYHPHPPTPTAAGPDHSGLGGHWTGEVDDLSDLAHLPPEAKVERVTEYEAAIPKIQKLLMQAARSGGSISYEKIYQCFPSDTPKHDVWNTFEEASRRLCTPEIAILGALLVGKDDLPSTGFYNIFMNKRYAEFNQIAPGCSSSNLSEDVKRAIVSSERQRILQNLT